jgi:hypothetical protein
MIFYSDKRFVFVETRKKKKPTIAHRLKQLDCKAAFKRFEEGVPGASATVDDSAKTIAETVQFFITAMVCFWFFLG